jgi:hypothetical protein
LTVQAPAGPLALERDERPVTTNAQDGIDFDVHGLVGVRLLDAGPRDAAAVRRQLGIAPAPLDREPDIAVRFVDRLETASPIRYLGPKDVGFTDDAFLVLRGKQKSRVRVQLPLAEIGRRPTILCERGAPAIPFLIPILNLTALANGALPLHASAFVHEGRGVVATGWSKGGKTEALLAFGANGAQYVGDEWVYLSEGGTRAFGLGEPIRVWNWHLRELPTYRTAIERSDRARLRTLGALLALDRAAGLIAPGPARRMRHLLEDQQRVDVDPARLFGAAARIESTRVDTVLFVESRDAPGVTVEAADPLDVAARMVASLQHERLPFHALYLKWKFAFPGAVCPLIEGAEAIERAALDDFLAGKAAYTVHHPYPVSLTDLYAAVAPYC